VESVRPTAAWHFASGVVIDDDDLAFFDDILNVLFIDAVGFEELGEGTPDAILLLEVLFDLRPGANVAEFLVEFSR
jgi:hypothetical protein